MNNQTRGVDGLGGSFTQSLAVLTFRTNEQVYALPITAVCQLIEMVAITPVPEAPPTIQGIINVHGEIVPVMDLRLRLGLPYRPYQLHTPIILMQANGRSLALVVDEVETVIEIDAADMQTDETVFDFSVTENGHQASNFSSIARVDKQLIIIIDTNRLVRHYLEAPLTQVLSPHRAESAAKAEVHEERAGV